MSDPNRMTKSEAAMLHGKIIMHLAKISKHPWRVRKPKPEHDPEGLDPGFVESPQQMSYASGTEVLMDDEYETKEADIDFVADAPTLLLECCRALRTVIHAE